MLIQTQNNGANHYDHININICCLFLISSYFHLKYDKNSHHNSMMFYNFMGFKMIFRHFFFVLTNLLWNDEKMDLQEKKQSRQKWFTIPNFKCAISNFWWKKQLNWALKEFHKCKIRQKIKKRQLVVFAREYSVFIFAINTQFHLLNIARYSSIYQCPFGFANKKIENCIKSECGCQ